MSRSGSKKEPRRWVNQAGLASTEVTVSFTTLSMRPAFFVAGIWAIYAALALTAWWAVA